MIELKDVNNSPDIKNIQGTKEYKETKEKIRSIFEVEDSYKKKERTADKKKIIDIKSEKRNFLCYTITGIIFLVLGLGLFYLSYISKIGIEQKYQQQLNSLDNKELNKLMQQASQSIKNKSQNFITRLNNIKSIPFESSSDLERLRKNLQSLLKDSVSIELVPADYNDDDIIDDPSMGYTFLFLLNELKGIKNTATANFTMIELYKGNSEGKKLLWVHKLMNNEKTIAYLIARLSTDFMNNLVTNFDTKGSYFEIIEQHGNTSFILVKKGNKSLSTLPIIAVKQLKNTPWKFKYWSDEQKNSIPIETFSNAIMLFVFSIIATLLSIMLFIFMIKKYYLLNPVVLVSEHTKTKSDDSFLSKLANTKTEDTFIPKVSEKMLNIADNIFGAYDIRGIVGDYINTETLRKISRIIAIEMKSKKQNKISIACDARMSSPQLIKAVIDNMLKEGINVLDLGMVVNTATLYYAAIKKSNGNGVMITAGHNPDDYNGLKIMLAGRAYSGNDLDSIRQKFILSEKDTNDEEIEKSKESIGEKSDLNIIEEYIKQISENIVLKRPLKIVVDTTNALTAKFVTILFNHLNCNVFVVEKSQGSDSPSRTFISNSPENMKEISNKVVAEKADIGFLFDDDRIGVVASDGQIILADRVLMLLAKDIISRNKDVKILYDIKSTKNLANLTKSLGGHAILCRSGYSYMQNKLEETCALLGGEMSGHIFIKERWYAFDDAIYAAARILEILSIDLRKSAPVFSELPNSINTPEILIENKDATAIIKKVSLDKKNFTDGEVITIDGVRVEYSDGWGVVRVSNTSKYLSIRFEADNKVALQRIANAFKAAILLASPDLELPF